MTHAEVPFWLRYNANARRVLEDLRTTPGQVLGINRTLTALKRAGLITYKWGSNIGRGSRRLQDVALTDTGRELATSLAEEG